MKKLLYAAVIAFTVTTANADPDEPLMSFKMLTPESALELAQATLADCRERGYQAAVAVVDRFGGVQVILRDRLAGAHTAETARRKAWTAAAFRTDTLAMGKATAYDQPASGLRQLETALMVGGGVPVQAAGFMVGAVGVSGAPGGQADDDCARAGIAAIADSLEF
jgi:uncharacterized protein GlcG (DUF336 family)